MNDFKASRFVAQFMKKHIGMSLVLAFAILGTSISSLLPSYTLKYLIDGFLEPAINGSVTITNGKIVGLSFLYFSTYLLVSLFTILQNYMIDVFGQKLIHELRYAMIEKSHRLTSSYFRRNGTGSMTSRVTDDVNSIEQLFAEGLVSLVVNLFKIIGILISVFIFSWVLGLILFAIIPVIYFITQAFRKNMLKNQLANRKILNEESNNLSETIDCNNTIKNLSKEGYREEEFKGLLNKGFKVMDKTGWFDSLYGPVIEILKAITISAVTLIVCYSQDTNSIIGLSIGTFAAAINLISNVFSPIQTIGQEIQTMQEGKSGIERVEKFMSEKEICLKEDSLKANDIINKKFPYLLEFKDLSFHYDDGQELIYDDMNLQVKKLEKICLVGRTGIGKTTLFRLILGILEPTKGQILFNGYDVTKIPDTEKRKIFGYVEQGFKAVPGSVMDQITLGDQSISLKEVRKAMSDSFLDDYVMKTIPNNYQAPFREEDFSQGQLQLLNLARATVLNPQLLLLDEISANLDSETEKEVIKALAKASNDRTVVSISHRLSDQLGFDRVIEVEKGKIISK